MQQKLEILDALAKLGEVLTRDEQIFLAEHADSAAKHFAAAKMATSARRLYRRRSIPANAWIVEVNLECVRGWSV